MGSAGLGERRAFALAVDQPVEGDVEHVGQLRRCFCRDGLAEAVFDRPGMPCTKPGEAVHGMRGKLLGFPRTLQATRQ